MCGQASEGNEAQGRNDGCRELETASSPSDSSAEQSPEVDRENGRRRDDVTRQDAGMRTVADGGSDAEMSHSTSVEQALRARPRSNAGTRARKLQWVSIRESRACCGPGHATGAIHERLSGATHDGGKGVAVIALRGEVTQAAVLVKASPRCRPSDFARPVTQHSLGSAAEQTARGQRDRGDAIRLSARMKPSKGARVTGTSPWTEAVFRHRSRPCGPQRGEPQVRIELQYARNLASEQTVEVVENHEDGAWATVGIVVPRKAR
jgi:hypothetical protein